MANILSNLPVISATDYNRIASFERQKHDIPPCYLEAIGNMLVHHNYHRDSYVCSKHRHFDLSAGKIMVHSRRPNGLIVCNIESVEKFDDLFPHSLSLNPEDLFAPFEYDSNPPGKLPPPALLEQLGQLVSCCNLQNVLALCLHPVSGVISEAAQDVGDGLQYTQKKDYDLERDKHEIVTGWRFEVEHGSIVALPCQTCQPKAGGRHHVPDEK